MYLSYSGFKSYDSCPKAYWYRYVGKTPLSEPENKVNSIYGSTVGRLFELFYANQIWKQSNTIETLLGMVEPELDDTIQKERRNGVIDYTDKRSNYASRDALVADIRAAIPRGIAIIRHHRLIGADAAAEVKYDTMIEGHTIGGRADFVLRRVAPHRDRVLLDGKGSRHREKYVDDRQLVWYAMLHRIRHGSPPDRLGFVFWRYEPEESLDWINFTAADLDGLLAHVLSTVRKIDGGINTLISGSKEVQKQVMGDVFQAQPGQGKCKLCSYLAICPEGQSFTAKHQIPVYAGEGVEDVGIGD